MLTDHNETGENGACHSLNWGYQQCETRSSAATENLILSGASWLGRSEWRAAPEYSSGCECDGGQHNSEACCSRQIASFS